MKNVTVEDFIEALKKYDPKSVVCSYIHDNPPAYSSIESVAEIDTVYIDDDGNDKQGKIVVIY